VWRVRSVWTWLGLLSMTIFSNRAFAEQALKPIIGVSVRICDYSALPARSLDRAEEAAAQVFAPVGIELRWVRCGSSSTVSDNSAARPGLRDPARLSVKILSRSMARRIRLPSKTCGYAISPDAFVFSECAKGFSRDIGLQLGSILGYLAAHELGHLLQGTADHTPAGIMTYRLTAADLIQAEKGLLGFTPEQGAEMRRLLVKRTGPVAFPANGPS
jgi:hypothetical protein